MNSLTGDPSVPEEILEEAFSVAGNDSSGKCVLHKVMKNEKAKPN